MYQNLHQSGIGGFLDQAYWSSSEAGASSAYECQFDDGVWVAYAKSVFYFNVRAARAF